MFFKFSWHYFTSYFMSEFFLLNDAILLVFIWNRVDAVRYLFRCVFSRSLGDWAGRPDSDLVPFVSRKRGSDISDWNLWARDLKRLVVGGIKELLLMTPVLSPGLLFKKTVISSGSHTHWLLKWISFCDCFKTLWQIWLHSSVCVCASYL